MKSEREDAVAIRVKLRKKGSTEILAERFLSLWQYPNYTGRQFMGRPSRSPWTANHIRVQLRNERITKPYTVELLTSSTTIRRHGHAKGFRQHGSAARPRDRRRSRGPHLDEPPATPPRRDVLPAPYRSGR